MADAKPYVHSGIWAALAGVIVMYAVADVIAIFYVVDGIST